MVFGSTLFTNLDDLSRLHRTVTNVAVVMAWIAAALLAVMSVITGDRHFLAEAIGPTIAGLTFTVLKALKIPPIPRVSPMV